MANSRAGFYPAFLAGTRLNPGVPSAAADALTVFRGLLIAA